MNGYRYTESGLDNVIIEGLQVVRDDHDDEVILILNVNALHRTIAQGIVTHRAAILPKELRFLRTEIGMTQARLAEVVHVDSQTIGRWERGETPIQPTADALIRRLVIECLKLDAQESIEQLSRRCMPHAGTEMITIDASGPGAYRLAA
jgi:DNA-binding transcriptional regulator YiaG